MGLREFIEKDRDWRDWAWIVFGWFAFPALLGIIAVIVIKAIAWFYSI